MQEAVVAGIYTRKRTLPVTALCGLPALCVIIASNAAHKRGQPRITVELCLMSSKPRPTEELQKDMVSFIQDFLHRDFIMNYSFKSPNPQVT